MRTGSPPAVARRHPGLALVLPGNAAGLDDDACDIAAQASAAWEAAVCWDDEYAIKRLAEVEAVGECGFTRRQSFDPVPHGHQAAPLIGPGHRSAAGSTSDPG